MSVKDKEIFKKTIIIISIISIIVPIGFFLSSIILICVGIVLINCYNFFIY